MDRAVRLLAARQRSIAELKERLLEKSWTDEAIVDSVIEKLKQYEYLDDEKFARDVAISKLRQRPQGQRRLRHSLALKKLDSAASDAAVEEAYRQLPESELIAAAIESRVRLKGPLVTREDLKRLFDHLMRRGFDYELIRTHLTKLKKDIAETNDRIS